MITEFIGIQCSAIDAASYRSSSPITVAVEFSEILADLVVDNFSSTIYVHKTVHVLAASSDILTIEAAPARSGEGGTRGSPVGDEAGRRPAALQLAECKHSQRVRTVPTRGQHPGDTMGQCDTVTLIDSDTQ